VVVQKLARVSNSSSTDWHQEQADSHVGVVESDNRTLRDRITVVCWRCQKLLARLCFGEHGVV